MAKRMGAKTIEVKASHLSLISQPDAITQLILEAAGLRDGISVARFKSTRPPGLSPLGITLACS